MLWGVYGTFANCSNLRELNLTGTTVEKVTDMRYTFLGCSSLNTLHLSGWNVENVTHMTETFKGCFSGRGKCGDGGAGCGIFPLKG